MYIVFMNFSAFQSSPGFCPLKLATLQSLNFDLYFLSLELLLFSTLIFFPFALRFRENAVREKSDVKIELVPCVAFLSVTMVIKSFMPDFFLQSLHCFKYFYNMYFAQMLLLFCEKASLV